MTNEFNGCRIYTHPSGGWAVGIVTGNNVATSNYSERYASEASATLAAKREHNAKPFMNFVAVRV